MVLLAELTEMSLPGCEHVRLNFLVTGQGGAGVFYGNGHSVVWFVVHWALSPVSGKLFPTNQESFENPLLSFVV